MENLSPIQREVLNIASTRPNGKIYPMKTVKGKMMSMSDRISVELALFEKNFICDKTIITTTGFLAIGLDPKNGDNSIGQQPTVRGFTVPVLLYGPNETPTGYKIPVKPKDAAMEPVYVLTFL